MKYKIFFVTTYIYLNFNNLFNKININILKFFTYIKFPLFET